MQTATVVNLVEHSNLPTDVFLKETHSKQSIDTPTKSSTSDKEKSDMAKFKILLVEDDPILQKIHLQVLRMLGCTVELAGDGKQALEKYFANNYDLIVLDGGLPDTNGFEIGKKIRAHEAPLGIRTPLLLLSAWTYELVEEGCLAADIDEFAIKPVRFEYIHAMVKRWLPFDKT